MTDDRVSTPDDFTIAPVRALTGHTSPDTAYVVEDYPYGFRLRCKIRYWIETATKGAAKGNQRFMSQTTNPKRPETVWNKPKGSTYSLIKVMYLDDIDHVQSWGVGYWLDPAHDVRARAMGIYGALSDDQRLLYDTLITVYRGANPESWEEWHDTVSTLAEHISTTGAPPILENKVWTSGNRRMYLSDPAAYVTAARNTLRKD